MLAAEQANVSDALLLLSYPLHPPRRIEQKRTAHWPEVHTPTLFVHGTRDPFGSPEELQEAAKEFGGRCEFLFVDGAAHELKPVLQRPNQVVEAWFRFMTGSAPDGTAGNSSRPAIVGGPSGLS
jgi:predicted alpha/beta-hydrolase family hydrolase